MDNLCTLATEAQSFYSSVWQDWYADVSVSPATLEIAISEHSPAYSPSRNLIYLALCDGDVADYARILANDHADHVENKKWRIWKGSLVHEMLHEYQHKAGVAEANEEGVALRKTHVFPFAPQDQHGEVYYTVIAEKAPYFGMTPQNLRDWI